MKKLVRRATNERESMIEFSYCLCGCPCSGNCKCPPIPTHQIGIEVGNQNKDSSGGSTVGSVAVSVH